MSDTEKRITGKGQQIKTIESKTIGKGKKKIPCRTNQKYPNNIGCFSKLFVTDEATSSNKSSCGATVTTRVANINKKPINLG